MLKIIKSWISWRKLSKIIFLSSYVYICVCILFSTTKGSQLIATGIRFRTNESSCSPETKCYQWDAWDVKRINEFKTSLDTFMKERSTGASQTQRQKHNTQLRKVRFSGMEGLARSSITLCLPHWHPCSPGSSYRPQSETLGLLLQQRGKAALACPWGT